MSTLPLLMILSHFPPRGSGVPPSLSKASLSGILFFFLSFALSSLFLIFNINNIFAEAKSGIYFHLVLLRCSNAKKYHLIRPVIQTAPGTVSVGRIELVPARKKTSLPLHPIPICTLQSLHRRLPCRAPRPPRAPRLLELLNLRCLWLGAPGDQQDHLALQDQLDLREQLVQRAWPEKRTGISRSPGSTSHIGFINPAGV